MAAALGLTATPALASSVSSATFTGSAGTVTVGGVLYAKAGATVTLTVATSNDTQCVDVVGAVTARETSATAKSSWTFTTTAGIGDGVQAVTVAASPNFNKNNNNCTGQTNSMQASYTLDNTGPVLTGSLSPAANANGWNSANTTLTWSATDGGSGVASGPNPGSSNENANGIFTRTSTATDRLGNTGSGSFTVRVDKAAPTITGGQTDNGDGTTTVTFNCTDNPGSNASGISSCLADGTSTPSKTVTGPATVNGTATDRAGNTSTATVNVAARDRTAPGITHSVAPAPNAAGWNKADATVTFSCSDNVAVASCVADGTSPASASKTVGTETSDTLVGGTATDTSGNTAKDSVTVKLDKTAPTATAVTDRPANANGWYNADVTVTYVCADSLSGVASCPPARALAQGANQSASGTAVDNAGNTSASAGVSGINVDKTPPVLTGSFSSGWHMDDAIVTWTCTDPLSGPAAQPANSIVTGEGGNLSASAACADVAGNTVSNTVSGIKIDRTAPLTTIAGGSNAWAAGDVTLTLTATDALSGVAFTQYTVDGGSPSTGTTITLSTEGDHTVTFASGDIAGNVEATHTVHVKIDKTAPTITHGFPSPAGYADSAWTNQDVQVTFTCADQGGSGVASCLGNTTVSTEGTAQHVTGTATDGAGNSASDTAAVSIDKTKPTITAASDRRANPAGWYNADVTVSFTCADDRSGVVSCPGSKQLGQGANQSASGTVQDTAGNSATDTLSGINVDTTAPVLTGSFPDGWHSGDVTVHWTCTDPLSGPAGQPADSLVTGEGDNLSATATCADKAGNTTTTTVTGIKIDRTPPTTGASVTGTTHNGWYAAGVQVSLDANDNLSDVAKTYYTVDGGSPLVYDAAVPVATDGVHTITFWSVDVAGNVEPSAGHTLTLQIDTTPPTLAGAPTSDPNAAGWYRTDVIVHWTCSDVTAGIDGVCPGDSTVTGEGDALSASASVSDVAGNATNTTVGSIKIDRTAPTTVGSVPAAPASGWYTAPVPVTLTASDNLSGVDATTYSVDGGEEQSYTGPFSVAGDGTHSVTFHSTDGAGNAETAAAPLVLKIDGTAPTTTVTNPISPDNGWFVTSGVPFAFTATDNQGGSGVARTSYTIDGGDPQVYGAAFTANLSDGTHTVTYWSVDDAGNEEKHGSFPINVDTTPPTIAGSQSPTANGFGWNNTDVAVTFTCSDATSGIQTGVAGCAGDTLLTNEGANQNITGDTVDVAGNVNQATYGPVNIDKTAPTLIGLPGAPNGAGWYNGNALVKWVGNDKLSGIDPNSQPADTVVTGEGRNLGASATISDKAGNTGNGSVSGVKIDRGVPTITGKPTTSPNAAGWYTGAVLADWTCADPKLADGTDGSGIAQCPTSSPLKGDGADQSVTSGTAPVDVAGNTGNKATVSGISIDGTPPATTANNQCTQTNGWCTGTTAEVVLSANDNLSGVKELHYKVDGGAEQVTAGATKTISVPLAGSGAGTVEYWAVDKADNVEATNKVALKWDNIAPTVTHTLSPTPSADEWNNADVTVTFAAADDDKGSGVASVTAPVTVTNETAGQVVTGAAKDTAGNVGTDTVTVKLDKAKPTITAAITAGAKGDNGWYTGPVTVSYTCGDALSGVVACPDPTTLTANGSNTATGLVSDKAGNAATATLSGIKIDQEKPTLTANDVNVAGGSYTLGTAPAATCTAKDVYSGVAACTVTVTGGNANGVGTFTWSATAKDNAGNTTTITGTYTVTYRFDGFLQPINDTAHQVGVSTSMFKAGSTVPVKFQLKNAAGLVVQPASAPDWITPVKGSATSAPVNETAYAASPDSGSDYRYDATAQQWIYNWKTGSTAGSYWRIGVRLDDGQTYYVNIGLR